LISNENSGGLTKSEQAKCDDLQETQTILHDGHRLILLHAHTIKHSPLHLFWSSIPFIPRVSSIYKLYANKVKKVELVTNNVGSWPSELATLLGHTGVVQKAVFSPDGQRLASASWDSKVCLWNSQTGALLATLEGHSDKVNCVDFSPDGQMLASASDDSTVCLWDSQTGAALATLSGHSEKVHYVVFFT
jgi:WD40 repeat protein